MAKGGYRPGSGRPPGSRNRPKDVGPPEDLTAVEYLNRLMNDRSAEPARRGRAASVLLTYENRLARTVTKKQQAEQAAATCHIGTKWERLLRRDPLPPAPQQTAVLEWDSMLNDPLPEDDEEPDE